MTYTTWYRASYSSWKIWEVKITRETVSSVWVYRSPLFDNEKPTERKEARKSTYQEYFPTAKEAYDALKSRAEKKKSDLEKDLAEINDFLDNDPKLWREKEYEPIPALTEEPIV